MPIPNLSHQTASLLKLNKRFYESLLRTILERDENPNNYQRTLRPLYRLNFSSQVITGISSDKAWAMI
jgi:hypothetical protein